MFCVHCLMSFRIILYYVFMILCFCQINSISINISRRSIIMLDVRFLFETLRSMEIRINIYQIRNMIRMKIDCKDIISCFSIFVLSYSRWYDSDLINTCWHRLFYPGTYIKDRDFILEPKICKGYNFRIKTRDR